LARKILGKFSGSGLAKASFKDLGKKGVRKTEKRKKEKRGQVPFFFLFFPFVYDVELRNRDCPFGAVLISDL
jgi:hypothetical protein